MGGAVGGVPVGGAVGGVPVGGAEGREDEGTGGGLEGGDCGGGEGMIFMDFWFLRGGAFGAGARFSTGDCC